MIALIFIVSLILIIIGAVIFSFYIINEENDIGSEKEFERPMDLIRMAAQLTNKTTRRIFGEMIVEYVFEDNNSGLVKIEERIKVLLKAQKEKTQ